MVTARFSEMPSPFPYGAVTSTLSTPTIYQTVMTLNGFTPFAMAENIHRSSIESPKHQTDNFCGYTSTTVRARFRMCKHACRSTVSSYKRRHQQLNKPQLIQAYEFNCLRQVLFAIAAAFSTNKPILTRPNPHLDFLLLRIERTLGVSILYWPLCLGEEVGTNY
jgi:hypothetical protein